MSRAGSKQAEAVHLHSFLRFLLLHSDARMQGFFQATGVSAGFEEAALCLLRLVPLPVGDFFLGFPSSFLFSNDTSSCTSELRTMPSTFSLLSS